MKKIIFFVLILISLAPAFAVESVGVCVTTDGFTQKETGKWWTTPHGLPGECTMYTYWYAYQHLEEIPQEVYYNFFNRHLERVKRGYEKNNFQDLIFAFKLTKDSLGYLYNEELSKRSVFLKGSEIYQDSEQNYYVKEVKEGFTPIVFDGQEFVKKQTGRIRTVTIAYKDENGVEWKTPKGLPFQSSLNDYWIKYNEGIQPKRIPKSVKRYFAAIEKYGVKTKIDSTLLKEYPNYNSYWNYCNMCDMPNSLDYGFIKIGNSIKRVILMKYSMEYRLDDISAAYLKDNKEFVPFWIEESSVGAQKTDYNLFKNRKGYKKWLESYKIL